MDLERKISQEIKKHRFSPYSLDELLEIVKTNKEMADLFREIGQDAHLFRLLTLHRLDLFGIDTEVNVPYFLYCNLPKSTSKSGNINVSSALKFIVSEKVEDVEERGRNFLTQIMGGATDIESNLKDIICYFLVDFFRSNPVLLSLANSKEFDYRSMKSEVKNYEDIDLGEYFNKKIGGLVDDALLDPVIRGKIEKVALQVVSSVMSKVDHTMENLHQLMPDITLYFHKQSVLWLSSIIEMTGMGVKAYSTCLDTMFRVKAIQNKHIVTWCDNCNKQEPTFETITGKIAPSNLDSRRVCLQCGNNKYYSFSAIYGLHDALKGILNSKDGLLATYLFWQLERKGYEVQGSRQTGIYETDILVNKKFLIECKVFRLDRDRNAVVENIKKAFRQMDQLIKQYVKEGGVIERAFLFWNLEEGDKEYEEMLNSHYGDLRTKFGFKIHPYHQIDNLISDMK